MDLDLGCFGHPKDRIIVEVALLDDAVLGGDLSVECGRKAKDDGAFHLCAHTVGIDGKTTIDGTDGSQDMGDTVLDADFEGKCHVGVKAKVVGKAFAVPFGQGLVPTEGITGVLDDCGQSFGVLGVVGLDMGGDLTVRAKQFEPIGDGIEAGFVGEFIDKAVDGEGVKDIADTTQPADVKGGFGASSFAKNVRDAVGHIECAHIEFKDHRAVVAGPEGVDEGGIDGAVVPREGYALFVEGGAEALEAFGVIKAVFDLIFACPLETDGQADLLGKQDRFEDKVGL